MKSLSSYLAILLIATVTTGCSYGGANYRNYASWTGLIPKQKTQRDSHWALDANAKVYIVTPALGHHDSELEAEFASLFRQYFPRTRHGQYRESLNQAFVSARLSGMDYVVYPQVTELVDQNSLGAVIREEIALREFAKGRAKMEIFIYASQGEELIDHLKLTTQGSILTSQSRQLIWPPLEEYLVTVSQYSLVRR